MSKILRGFTINVHHAGDPEYVDEKQHAWAEKGSLPKEWEQAIQDPTVDQAQLYTSAQQHVQATKRKYVARYPEEED